MMRPIIARVIAEHGSPDISPELRRKLRAAWRWGPRKMLPYKVWCDEIARQTGRRPNGKPVSYDRTLSLL